MESGSPNERKRPPMTDAHKRKIVESRFRNKLKRHHDKLTALRIYDIMTRVARGDYN